MGHPWVAREFPVGLFIIADPWCTHGSPMSLPRWPMGHPWDIHGSPVGLRYWPMRRLWVSHGFLVAVHGGPWVARGKPMGPPVGIAWDTHELHRKGTQTYPY